eukprot:m.88274 g.88274  ORF g.88274 m.88274 type:complete len:1349 (-) comp8804_c0_seq1:2050-6096(-)
MAVEFQIPTDIDGLLATEASVFSVASEINISKISEYTLAEMIQETKMMFQDGTEIYENSVFDLLYSIAKHFASISPSTQRKAFDCLLSGFQCFMKTLGENIEGASPSTSQGMLLQNCCKMYAYLINVIAVEEETNANKASNFLTAATSKKSKKQKKTNEFDWQTQRERSFSFILTMLRMDVARLWPMSFAEEPFVNLITRIVYLSLENPEVIKDKDTFEQITDLLAILNQKYNHAPACSTSIVHLLPHFEHLATPLASMLHSFVTKNKCPNVVDDVLREIGRMDPTDFVKDASGARYFSAFLVELGSLLPDSVLPSLSVLLPHLDGEAYPIRNGILRMCGSILQHTLRSNVNEAMKRSRDEMLSILQERLVDSSAYVRKTALQVWQDLAASRSIPLTALNSVVTSCVIRLEDKSSLVRKQAIAFVTSILTNNPYGDKLVLASFETLMKEAEESLNVLIETYGKKPPIASKEEEEMNTSIDENMEQNDDEERSNENDEEPKESNEQRQEPEELTKQRVLTKYYQDAVFFTSTVNDAIPIVAQLLGSKTVTDVVEAIQCLVTAAKFSLASADDGMRKMLALVWNKEMSVQQAVLEAYKQLYFKADPNIYSTKKEQCGFVVKNMMRLVRNMNLADRSSFKELINVMIKENVLEDGVFKQLWDIFSSRVPNTSFAHVCSSLAILGMASESKPQLIKDNVGLILSMCKVDERSSSLRLCKEAAIALSTLVGNDKISSRSVPKKFPCTHPMFSTLFEVLLETANYNVKGYTMTVEAVIDMVYKLSEHPDALATSYLKGLYNEAFKQFKENEGEAEERELVLPVARRLTRLLFAVGHVAMKQLVFTDFVQLEMKRRRGIEDDLRSKDKGKGGKKSKSEDEESEEMGVGGANADDLEADFIANICEKELLEPHAMLGQFKGLILGICTNPQLFCDEDLQSASVLALTKFMCISVGFCEEHLQLLFTILQNSVFSRVRCNAIVALGDLAFRFPNLIEPWTDHLYARLKDDDDRVRKNAVMVLTHLILNDMVKVKGQISGLAICLEDSNERISSLSKLFFLELSRKGNAIYNILPDVISHVSNTDITFNSMSSIMTYLFGFIKKDRHAESLVEKLSQRFRTTRDVSHWRNFAFCLSLINYSDRCIKKLADQFSCFKDKLGDKQVYESFASILSKASKFAKPEMKEAVTELTQKIAAAHFKGAEGAEVEANAAKARKTKRGKSKKQAKHDDSEDEEASEEAEQSTLTRRSRRRVGQEQDKSQIAIPKAQSSKKNGGRRRQVVEESDDSDISELDLELSDEEKDEDDFLMDDFDDEEKDDDEEKRPKAASSRKPVISSKKGKRGNKILQDLNQSMDDLMI